MLHEFKTFFPSSLITSVNFLLYYSREQYSVKNTYTASSLWMTCRWRSSKQHSWNGRITTNYHFSYIPLFIKYIFSVYRQFSQPICKHVQRRRREQIIQNASLQLLILQEEVEEWVVGNVIKNSSRIIPS